MPLNKQGELTACLIQTNCVLVEWKIENINQAYEKLIEIASDLPRTTLLERSENYWHGLCRSFLFRFPDDLEILRLPRKGVIQVRSASRLGLGDLGVNRNRVNKLYKTLKSKC
ncbi:DUF1499 domain-containing protein [Prochlorococcus sp. MIT 1307]|uniref:DUF1499 domain-containing protein n=1 Tax=Prochlorococcus sp. MIT 1307 TaxID=3096219 RepID=UPI002A76649E|nr:DUF1499 domain-containing protein [Prochlorococcus sp. MIT 1307]